MGHIIMPAFAFRASLSEDAGARSGFTLTDNDLFNHLDPESDIARQLRSKALLRLPANAYADAVGDLLFALGAAETKGMPTLAMRLMSILGDDWRDLFALREMLHVEAIAREYLQRRNWSTGDQDEVYAELKTLFSGKTLDVWDAMQEAMAFELAHSPFYTRTLKKADSIALSALFKSEKLPVEADRFFDQRFINYLGAQPDKLDAMHWRQFEGLTAEWFQREGYSVELGTGRSDGGVDVRLWNPDSPPGAPPTVIVQCKRQKDKIAKVVVKGLYADLLHEQANSGMIVTTSDLSPGAANDISARAYPITTANRNKVQEWVEAMRIPSSGIVLDFEARTATE
ncbi:MAG: restriction endonuclease [Alphaproteobacteria bacterium]|nr:restriction endonuclease [Alphaproteobacteria bacterium]MBU0799233.1 restriction endonuclease [Alphaproteobacteria bacterium]MBU0887515.1 restriction endonuclease [Alphaproteobacteria bacterium]MBU1814752.1 restriction endonuclease [Alphaproteobacteria bacterium]